MCKKSLKEKLKKVPLQTRLQIMEEIRKSGCIGFVKRLNTKLITEESTGGLFSWSNTRKGFDYWLDRSLKIDRCLK